MCHLRQRVVNPKQRYKPHVSSYICGFKPLYHQQLCYIIYIFPRFTLLACCRVGVNPQDIAFWIDVAVANGISVYFQFSVSLTSPLRNGESLSIGVNPLHRAASRRLNPRDFSPAALLSHRAKPGLATVWWMAAGKSTPLMSLWINVSSLVCADAGIVTQIGVTCSGV